MFRETIEIEKQPRNFNRKEESVNVSKSFVKVLDETEILPITQHGISNAKQPQPETPCP